MALIAMAVYSTEENRKDDCLLDTFHSLCNTVDFTRHRLIVSINAVTERTEKVFGYFQEIIQDRIYNEGNIGTAAAINKVWRQRKPGEHCVKMDDDVVIHNNGWLNELEEAIDRDDRLGQCGLKRKDCWEYPTHPNPDLRSQYICLPHPPGQRWITVERAKHIMGTCVLHSSALLDKVGYLWQPNLYGYDDVLMSWRSNLAGFYTCFLPHIEIDHIDPGDTPYQSWKERHSGQYQKLVSDIVDEYISGKRSLYYDGGFNK